MIVKYMIVKYFSYLREIFYGKRETKIQMLYLYFYIKLYRNISITFEFCLIDPTFVK